MVLEMDNFSAVDIANSWSVGEENTSRCVQLFSAHTKSLGAVGNKAHVGVDKYMSNRDSRGGCQ